MGIKLKSPKAILSYPHLAEPRMDKKGKLKYSCGLIFPAGTDLSGLQEAATAAAEEAFGKGGAAKLLSGVIRNPLRSNPADVAEKGYPVGSTFTNVRSDRKPGAVYLFPATPGSKTPAIIADEDIEEKLYPGAIVIASLSAFGYDVEGNKGVSFGLNNLQLIDGTAPRIDGRKAADEEFEADLNATADLSDVGAE